MSKTAIKKALVRARRKKHIHKIVHGTPARPRLVVFRSLRHVYAQLVDDVSGKTITGISSVSPELRARLEKMKPQEACAAVGEACARLAMEKDIHNVVFDRNGFHYHGRVKAVADGARKGGLKF